MAFPVRKTIADVAPPYDLGDTLSRHPRPTPRADNNNGEASQSLDRTNSLHDVFTNIASDNDAKKNLVIVQRDNGTHATIRVNLDDSLDQMLLRATQTQDPHLQHSTYEQLVFDSRERLEESSLDPHALSMKAFALMKLESLGRSAAAFTERGEVESARATYQELLAINPFDVHALNNAALLCIESDDLDGAQKFLEQSLAIDPSNAIVRLNLADIFEARNDTDAMLEQLRMIDEQHAKTVEEQHALNNYLDSIGEPSLKGLIDRLDDAPDAYRIPRKTVDPKELKEDEAIGEALTSGAIAPVLATPIMALF